MKRRISIVLAVGTAILVTSGAMFAHHSFASEFDDSMAVRVQGVVVSVEMVNPHSFIYLDVKAPHGAVERWALEGPGPFQIARRRQLDLAFIKVGEPLGACGYLARSDVALTRTEPASARAARKLQAAVLLLANDEQLVWNNYRQGKCGLDH